MKDRPAYRIGITGQKGAGKTMLARMIMSKIMLKEGILFEHVNFADAIKEEVTAKHGLLPGAIDWDHYGTKKRYRIELQNTGDDYRYVFGEDYWIQKWRKTTKHMKYVICSDVRLKPEADEFDLLISVINSYKPLKTPDKHRTETEWETMVVDYVVRNDSSIASMRTEVSEMYDEGIFKPIGDKAYDNQRR